MKTCRLPALLGMMLTGVLLGPNVFDLIDPSILSASVELREIALVVILIRAGLAMDLKDLRRVGRPAFLMSFVPATFELAAVVIFAPLLLGVSYLDAALLGGRLGGSIACCGSAPNAKADGDWLWTGQEHPTAHFGRRVC